MNGLSIGHCVSRSVRDSAALLDLTSGADLGDPYWAPPNSRPFLREVGADPGPLRIAFMTEKPSGDPVHPDCKAAVQEAAELCTELGHELVEASLPIDGEAFTQAFIVMWAAGCAWSVKGIELLSGVPASPKMYEPLTWTLYEMGERTSAADYLLAVQQIQQMARRVAQFFTQFDLLLTPVLAEPPLPLGSFEPTADNSLSGFERAIDYVPFTPIANATGQPAMSVPLYWNEEGLPIGTHFIGNFGAEATLFQLAAQLEEARPWAHRKPNLAIE